MLLLTGMAPGAAADAPLAADGWLGMLGRSVGTWLSALKGDDPGQRGVTAASELGPGIDPDGDDLAPSLDPNGDELTTSSDGGSTELAPRLDPNG